MCSSQSIRYRNLIHLYLQRFALLGRTLVVRMCNQIKSNCSKMILFSQHNAMR